MLNSKPLLFFIVREYVKLLLYIKVTLYLESLNLFIIFITILWDVSVFIEESDISISFDIISTTSSKFLFFILLK